MVILLIADTIHLKKKGENTYPVQILILCLYLVMWTKEDLVILSIIAGIWLVAITGIVTYHKKELVDKNSHLKIPMGAYICFSNIALMIMQNFLQ